MAEIFRYIGTGIPKSAIGDGMRIGVDAYPVTRHHKAGISYYTDYILKYLLSKDVNNEYVLYKGNNLLNKYSTSWLLFESGSRIIKDKIDVFWGTQGLLPWGISKHTKSVITIYDAVFFLYPEAMAIEAYIANKIFLKRSILKASHITVISESTKNAILNIFKDEITSDNISVIYPGIDLDRFKPVNKDIARKYVSGKFNIEREYILFVSTIEPRKNITGLLKAFKILKDKRQIPHQLVLAGAEGWKTKTIFDTLKKLSFKGCEVNFLGYRGEEDIAKLYSGADLFCLPSFYEGFGMPVLEAMASGVPVVTSDIPVFREILNGAGLSANPEDPENIADKMYKCLSQKELKNSLVQKGLNRVKDFSWEASGQKMLNVLTKR